MYQDFAYNQNWTFEIINISETDLGGIRNVIGRISGTNVFGSIKYERGVHRVQRVPVTESNGKLQTSTIIVVVLPESTEKSGKIEIERKDMKIDTYRAGGAGGQHVNTTDSAVRITHIPSGIVVAVQNDRSQHKNKADALKILKAKLYDKQKTEQEQKDAAERKLQAKTGDRSERIRTYNYNQDRITDHRIGLSLSGIDDMLKGNQLSHIHEELEKKVMTELVDGAKEYISEKYRKYFP
eukprot:TRINITY_DN1643_c0_g1_i2.p1 TRINITY_DN1643_c0_g1~~TRINITY_DN1643_c0_g1_i2.p1  ORF type:complete len:239 (-),score=59.21 TRINITY_DN1643_c0_g1_i2:73-789(-)